MHIYIYHLYNNLIINNIYTIIIYIYICICLKILYLIYTILYYNILYIGTEDVVRIYAEASTGPEVEKLLINAVDIIKKYLP